MAPLTEATDPLCLDPDAAAELLAGAPWRRFASIGDSLSAGTGDPTPGYRRLGWADRVADVLRRVVPELAYENTAVVGATTADALREQVAPMQAFAPDLLHLPSGANDLFGRRPDFGAIEARLAELFALGAGTGAVLTAFTFGRAFVIPAYDDWPERVRRVNEVVRGLAVEHDVVLVDMWAHPVNERPNLVGADGIHFSTSGQAVLATEMVKALAERLAKRRWNSRVQALTGTGG